MKRTVAIVFLILLLIVLLIALYLVSHQTWSTGKAMIVNAPSIDNSYLFASPIIAKANGEERIRLTVFILDSQGLGVANKTVFLGQHKDLTIEKIHTTTDNVGKAVFDLSTLVPADYLLEAQVDGKTLTQKVKVIFK